MNSIAIIIILSLFVTQASGQRPHTNTTAFDEFKKEDSLDGLSINKTQLKVITDTLPLYSDDELDGWRKAQLVNYFYDSSNVVKKITFWNRQEGYYYFYFEGTNLKKVRLLKPGYQTSLNYYFSDKDNMYKDSEIELRIKQDPERKEFYETLKMGRAFLEKFKALL